MKKETGSFIVLLLLAVVLSVTALFSTYRSSEPLAQLPPTPRAQTSASPWQEYSDSTYNLKFQYPKGWQVQAASTDPQVQAYVINLQPNDGSYPVKIFVSDRGYVGLANLQTETATVGGLEALKVDDGLAAVKLGVNYFTFDLGRDLALQPEFKTLLASVQFR